MISKYNKCESGKTSVVAMLSTLLLILAYMIAGRTIIQTEFPVIIDHLSLAILGVLSIFSIGYGLHMTITGDKSTIEARKDIRARLIEYGDFVDFANERLEEFERSAKFHLHAIRPAGQEGLSQSRRIVQALAKRVTKINSLLLSKNTMDLIEAEELINRNLEISENCVEALIGVNPIAPIPMDECISKVSGLLDRVAIEIGRLNLDKAA